VSKSSVKVKCQSQVSNFKGKCQSQSYFQISVILSQNQSQVSNGKGKSESETLLTVLQLKHLDCMHGMLCVRLVNVTYAKQQWTMQNGKS